MRKKLKNGIIGMAVLVMLSMTAMVSYADSLEPGMEDTSSVPSFIAERFVLPEDARMLVVVEAKN